MYAAGEQGRIFSLNIDTARGSLTCTNCNKDEGQPVIGKYNINAMWLDDANDKLYLVSDDSSYAIAKIDVSNQTKLTIDYGYSQTYDMTDLKYLGDNASSDHRFIIGTDYHSSDDEFLILDDDSSLSKFVKVTGVDLSNYSGKSVYVRDINYTNNNEVFVMAEDSDGDPYGMLYVIDDVTTSASPSPSVSLVENSIFGYYHTYHHPMDYSDAQGGAFFGSTYTGQSGYYNIFLDQSEVSSPGQYDSSGNLVSSKLDIGSTDQELHSITISQDIPSGCDIDITLEVDDNSSFSSATSQVFSSTTSDFTEEVNSNMQGKRWLRYTVDMTACNSNADGPTLYSFKLNYR